MLFVRGVGIQTCGTFAWVGYRIVFRTSKCGVTPTSSICTCAKESTLQMPLVRISSLRIFGYSFALLFASSDVLLAQLDMMRSALPALQSVTHHTPVLIVSGSHDVRSGPASVEALNLTNPDTRHTWVAQHGGKHTIGSVQYGRHTNITHVTCLNAGHMITLKSAFFHCLRFTVCEELNAEQRNCSMGRSNT